MKYVYAPPIQTTGLGFTRSANWGVAQRGSIIGQQDIAIFAKWIFEYSSLFWVTYSVFGFHHITAFGGQFSPILRPYFPCFTTQTACRRTKCSHILEKISQTNYSGSQSVNSHVLGPLYPREPVLPERPNFTLDDNPLVKN